MTLTILLPLSHLAVMGLENPALPPQIKNSFHGFHASENIKIIDASLLELEKRSQRLLNNVGAI